MRVLGHRRGKGGEPASSGIAAPPAAEPEFAVAGATLLSSLQAMPTATQMTSMVARQYLTLETAKTASGPLSFCFLLATTRC